MPMLSDRKIRDTKAESKELWLSDSNGLVIRTYKSGEKTWFIRHKQNGKTVTETLGDFPNTTCADARKAFATKSFKPNINKMTFGKLLDEWYKKRIEPRYKVKKNAIVYVNRAKEKFGSALLAKLTAPQLVRWLLPLITGTTIGKIANLPKLSILTVAEVDGVEKVSIPCRSKCGL